MGFAKGIESDDLEGMRSQREVGDDRGSDLRLSGALVGVCQSRHGDQSDNLRGPSRPICCGDCQLLVARARQDHCCCDPLICPRWYWLQSEA